MIKIRQNDNTDHNMTIKMAKKNIKSMLNMYTVCIYVYREREAAILWKEPFAGAFGQKRIEPTRTNHNASCFFALWGTMFYEGLQLDPIIMIQQKVGIYSYGIR